jgi:hypothetical protein
MLKCTKIENRRKERSLSLEYTKKKDFGFGERKIEEKRL